MAGPYTCIMKHRNDLKINPDDEFCCILKLELQNEEIPFIILMILQTNIVCDCKKKILSRECQFYKYVFLSTY